MKKLFHEFRDFAMRGNVIDLAVGVVIGAAFSASVNSLVNDIVSPLRSAAQADVTVLEGAMGYYDGIGMGSDASAFLTAVINFLIVALSLFALVKAVNSAKALFRRREEEAPAAPTTKTCPYCKSEIALGATRCPHCTSEQPETE